jgi:hypothetical protein
LIRLGIIKRRQLQISDAPGQCCAYSGDGWYCYTVLCGGIGDEADEKLLELLYGWDGGGIGVVVCEVDCVGVGMALDRGGMV